MAFQELTCPIHCAHSLSAPGREEVLSREGKTGLDWVSRKRNVLLIATILASMQRGDKRQGVRA